MNAWSLAGCGDDDGDGSPTGSSPDQLIGSWRFVKFNLPDALVERVRTAYFERRFDESGVDRFVEHYTSLYVSGEPTIITFNNDNTWTGTDGGSGTWSASSGQLTIDEDEEESVTGTFRVSSSTLVIKFSAALLFQSANTNGARARLIASLGDLSGIAMENEYTQVN